MRKRNLRAEWEFFEDFLVRPMENRYNRTGYMEGGTGRCKRMFHYSRRKQKKTQSAAAVLKSGIDWLTNYFVSAYIVFIMAVLPFYTEHGYSYIATEKSLFFRRCSIYMGCILGPLLILNLTYGLAVCIQQKKSLRDIWGTVRGKLTLADGFAGVYALALTASYLCTDYREEASWGADGWYMGFYTQLILLCIYFLVSKLWRPRKEIFFLMLASSWVVFLLGILNRFSIYPVKMERASPGFISTIGNINWYCGYAVTVFFAGAALLWQGSVPGKQKERWKNVLLALYVWTGFGTIVTQGSASGIAALGAAMLVMFFLSAGEGQKMVRFWFLASLLGAACLLAELWRRIAPGSLNYQDALMDFLTDGAFPIVMTIVSLAALRITWRSVRKKCYPGKTMEKAAGIIVTILSVSALAYIAALTANTLYPGSIGTLSQYGIFTFSGEWGSKRGATWAAGIRCFLEQPLLHKLVGIGPDAMEAYLYRDGSQELMQSLQEVFGNHILTNVHNEWLTVLLDTGVLGLASFGGMIVSAGGTFLKRMRKNPIAGACGFSVLAYTVNNMFSFQQVMNVTAVYIIMGMGMAFCTREAPDGIGQRNRQSFGIINDRKP